MDKKDTIVASVLAKYKNRAEKGHVKYNKTMDRNDLSLSEWLIHLQEELMDATLYIEKLKQEVQYSQDLRGDVVYDCYGCNNYDPDFDLCCYANPVTDEKDVVNIPHLEFGPCSMHNEVSEEAIMEALEDHPKHFDQPFPDDWDEFLEEELEGSIAADLEEIRREERMKIIGQNGNDGLHYGTEEDGTGYVDYPENRRTLYPGDVWVTTHTGPRPCGWDNTKKDEQESK